MHDSAYVKPHNNHKVKQDDDPIKKAVFDQAQLRFEK